MEKITFDPNIIIILSVIFITIFEGIAQTCLKTYNGNDTNLFIIIALFCYALVCFLLLQCYKHNGYMGHINLMWSCFSIIFVIGAGCFFFDEKFTPDDLIAVLLAFGAIYFVNRD